MFGNKPATSGTGFSFGQTNQTAANGTNQTSQQQQQQPAVTIGSTTQSVINPPNGPTTGTTTNFSLPVSVNTSNSSKLLKELLNQPTIYRRLMTTFNWDPFTLL